MGSDHSVLLRKDARSLATHQTPNEISTYKPKQTVLYKATPHLEGGMGQCCQCWKCRQRPVESRSQVSCHARPHTKPLHHHDTEITHNIDTTHLAGGLGQCCQCWQCQQQPVKSSSQVSCRTRPHTKPQHHHDTENTHNIDTTHLEGGLASAGSADSDQLKAEAKSLATPGPTRLIAPSSNRPALASWRVSLLSA